MMPELLEQTELKEDKNRSKKKKNYNKCTDNTLQRFAMMAVFETQQSENHE